MAFPELRQPSIRTAALTLLGLAAVGLLARYWSSGYPGN